jgi:hypothetical protein
MSILDICRVLTGPHWRMDREAILSCTRAWVNRVIFCHRDKHGDPLFQPATEAGPTLQELMREQLERQGWPTYLIPGELERRITESSLPPNPFPGA